ncbi:hypothetical protein JIG36_37425 [Actinoplanes sp. LDG1-06]|uniref:Uncharacterized protein n=1 Tax=Paractinoplanes ovalisporus TaxID=2810368 RepID=A0ABS2APR8_9ACTN|nr:hypothetical protein [Actinoplanes ovalisporus]MBM2621199.1 hypothetical protein [Actinoplanes ovalisporus]
MTKYSEQDRSEEFVAMMPADGWWAVYHEKEGGEAAEKVLCFVLRRDGAVSGRISGQGVGDPMYDAAEVEGFVEYRKDSAVPRSLPIVRTYDLNPSGSAKGYS